jgi:ATP:corrinoid adenosyltransferase
VSKGSSNGKGASGFGTMFRQLGASIGISAKWVQNKGLMKRTKISPRMMLLGIAHRTFTRAFSTQTQQRCSLAAEVLRRLLTCAYC